MKNQTNTKTQQKHKQDKEIPKYVGSLSNLLHSAVLLKDTDTSGRILLPGCQRWHQIAESTHMTCNSNQSSKKNMLEQLLATTPVTKTDEILHCCIFGSSRTSTLTLSLIHPLVCRTCVALFSCQRCISIVKMLEVVEQFQL